MPEPIQLVVSDDPDVPPGVLDYFGTDVVDGVPAVDFDSRRSRCYELAGLVVLTGAGGPRARLVHGSWHGPGAPQRIGHAWVELPTPEGRLLIWEPIRALVYDAVAFRKWTSAWDERTYSRDAARKLALASGHYGRWHESRYP